MKLWKRQSCTRICQARYFWIKLWKVQAQSHLKHSAQLPLFTCKKPEPVQIGDTGMNKRTETLFQENKNLSDLHEKDKNREWVKAETVTEKSNMSEKPMLTKAKSYTLATKKSRLWRMPWEQHEGGESSLQEQHQKNNRPSRGKYSSEQKSPRLVLRWHLVKLWKDSYGVFAYHSRIMDSVTQQIPLIPTVI